MAHARIQQPIVPFELVLDIKTCLFQFDVVRVARQGDVSAVLRVEHVQAWHITKAIVFAIGSGMQIVQTQQ